MRERDHLEDIGVDEKKILKWIFKDRDMGHGLNWYGSGQGQVTGLYECRNEPPGSIKHTEFID